MKFDFNVGDTNFLALVNANKYYSFVNEDWELSELKEHFIKEADKNNILVFQMTNEGIESDWKIEVEFNDNEKYNKCFRKAVGYIEVNQEELCFVEYTCLTMAAQFEDEKVPDSYCEKFKFQVDNGIYKVNIIQFYDVDNEQHYGRDDTDILFQLVKVKYIPTTEPKVYWYTY